MTNTFSTPTLARAPWQITYPITDYGKTTPEIRELMVDASRTAQIFYVDSKGYIRRGLKPTLVYSNSDLLHIEVNLSNEEFLPAKLPEKIL